MSSNFNQLTDQDFDNLSADDLKNFKNAILNDNQELIELYSLKARKIDPVLSAGISTTPEEQARINPVEDFGRGLLSGVSMIPRAAGQFGSQYLRPLIGKEPLSEERLQSRLGMLGAADYQPVGLAGKAAKIGGEIVPFLHPALSGPRLAGVAGRIGTGALTGGYYGGIESLARGEKLPGIARGALSGAIIGAAVPGGGLAASKATEKAAPTISKFLSGIPEEATQRLIDVSKKGGSVFAKPLKPTLESTGRQLKGIKEGLGIPESEFKKIGIKFKQFKDINTVPQSKITQDYYNIADNALGVMNKKNSELGKISGVLQKELEDPKLVANTDNLLKDINNFLASKQFMGESRIAKNDLSIIKSIRDEIISAQKRNKGDITLGQLNNIKTRWQSELSNLFDRGRITAEGDASIKQVLGILRNTISKNAPNPKLVQANEELARFKTDIFDVLNTKLKGSNRDIYIKSIKEPKEQLAFNQLDEMLGGKLSKSIQETGQLELSNESLNRLFKGVDFKNPKSVLNKNLEELQEIKDLTLDSNTGKSLVDEVQKLVDLEQNKKALGGLIKESDIRNPFNILNKTDDEILQLRQIAPDLLDELDNLATQAEFGRSFAFQRSPVLSNRIDQQSSIEQMNILKSLVGLGGAAGGGLAGGALGLAGTTALQSPKLQAKLIESLIKTGRPSQQINRLPSLLGVDIKEELEQQGRVRRLGGAR